MVPEAGYANVDLMQGYVTLDANCQNHTFNLSVFGSDRTLLAWVFWESPSATTFRKTTAAYVGHPAIVILVATNVAVPR